MRVNAVGGVNDDNSRPSPKDILEAVRGCNDQVCHRLDTLFNANATIIARIEEISGGLSALAAANADLRLQCDSLRAENGDLRDRLSAVSERLGYLEGEACACDLIVSGAPESPNEDLSAIVCSIADALQLDITRTSVSSATRLGSRTAAGVRPRSILVKLSSRELRNRFIALKRKKGDLAISDVPRLSASTEGGGKIYINESLLPATRRLFAEARRFAAANGWRRAWVRGGAVMLRKDDSAGLTRIRCAQDLDGLRADE